MFNKISGQKPKYIVQQEALRAQANVKSALNQCLKDTDVFIKKQLPKAEEQKKKAEIKIGLLAKTASKLAGKK